MRQDPHSYADDVQPNTQRLDLDLHVDFNRHVVTGTVTLHLDRDTGGPLDLDTRALTISSVKDAHGAALPFTLGANDAILGACLTVQLPKGTRSVVVAYETSPDASALQWLQAEQTAGKKHPYLFSQCQAIHARSLVPCQDTPRIRVTYGARLHVPKGLTAVMAAAPAGSTPSTGGTTFAFEMPQPIPSYLLALAVGDIAQQDLSPRCRVYAEPSVLAAAAAEFSGVEHMVTSAEALFGPYPWERFDMLVMPPSFPYGGMENPRLTFLTPTLLAGDKSLVNVVIHELSHSWTGNLVTNASLEHFWLNEGFTVYAERRILEALEGKEATALHQAIGLSGLKEDMARLGMGKGLTALLTRLGGTDPDEVYSQVPYEKGCLFVMRLEQAVGRAAWDTFLRAYITEFRFRSITTEDFVAFLKARLPDAVKAVDLKVWIEGEGLPPDAAQPKSARLEELQGMATAWGKGTRPSEAALLGLTVHDWQVLLPRLEKLPTSDCAWLQEKFRMMDSGNMEVRVAFLTLCARAGFKDAWPSVEKTLKGVGRMKYLRPLYTALKATPEGATVGRRILEEAKAGYHPVARGVMENLMRA